MIEYLTGLSLTRSRYDSNRILRDTETEQSTSMYLNQGYKIALSDF